MGRHDKDGEGSPYGPGDFERGLLPFLRWWQQHLLEPTGEFFEKIMRRIWDIRRSRRWLICGAMGILTLIITALSLLMMVRADTRDEAIASMPGSEQGILFEEDYTACRMRVNVHGEEVSAKTACNTDSSFPAGTQISVIQDPSDPEYYVVVSPEQHWQETSSDEVWFGIIFGSAAALAMVWFGYYLLLHPDRPISAFDSGPSARGNDAHHRTISTPISAALEDVDDFWELRKAVIRNGWLGFIAAHRLLRVTIFSVLLNLASIVVIAQESIMGADLAHDRSLATTERAVDATVIDLGGRGQNVSVRFGTTAVVLDYRLRWEFRYKEGDTVAVVQDPQDPGRLIPVEIADSRGLPGFLWDNAPLIITWLAVGGFLAWLLIPREAAALADGIATRLPGGRRKTRH